MESRCRFFEGRFATTQFGAFDIHAEHKDKEFGAQVNADGTITYDGESYTSPSSAGKAAIKKSVDGWTFWRFKKDGTDVPLDGSERFSLQN
jgi:hypothetical protein